MRRKRRRKVRKRSLRQPAFFHDMRIARLKPQELRMLLDELFGHVRQLQATVQGIANAHTDVMARLQEVVYREDSTYARWTKVAKDMADVPPPEEE